MSIRSAGFYLPQIPLPNCLPLLPVGKKWRRELPKLLVAEAVRHSIKQLPLLKVSTLQGEHQLERAMMLLSYFGHAFVWGETMPATHLPANLAVPWYAVAQRLGRPPVLSYASYALHNWRRSAQLARSL